MEYMEKPDGSWINFSDFKPCDSPFNKGTPLAKFLYPNGLYHYFDVGDIIGILKDGTLVAHYTSPTCTSTTYMEKKNVPNYDEILPYINEDYTALCEDIESMIRYRISVLHYGVTENIEKDSPEYKKFEKIELRKLTKEQKLFYKLWKGN